ncbi:MAG: sulfotransferase [Roseobacter sp.]
MTDNPNMTQNIQSFFIVGAPRCGTTAMARYLGKHPNICFAKPKETHYFLFSRPDLSPEAQRQQFLDAYFPNLSSETLMIGEGAVSTLYSKDALQRILNSFESPKFIVMLRDPVELIRSYHARLLHLRQENEEDLPTAWGLQEERSHGRHIPRNCQDPRVLQYREIARLGFYSRQLLDLVGAENCMPLFFDDFLDDTLSSYKNVLQFLDIPYDGRVEFKRVNSASKYKSGLLQSIYSGPLLRPVANQLLRNPIRAAQLQRGLRKLRKKVKRINAVDATPLPLDPVFAAELRERFADDLKVLGRTFDRDLTNWTTGRTNASKSSKSPQKNLRM